MIAIKDMGFDFMKCFKCEDEVVHFSKYGALCESHYAAAPTREPYGYVESDLSRMVSRDWKPQIKAYRFNPDNDINDEYQQLFAHHNKETSILLEVISDLAHKLITINSTKGSS